MLDIHILLSVVIYISVGINDILFIRLRCRMVPFRKVLREFQRLQYKSLGAAFLNI